jgi:uncharacterized membrane protein YtjA (UPF0391 family)
VVGSSARSRAREKPARVEPCKPLSFSSRLSYFHCGKNTCSCIGAGVTLCRKEFFNAETTPGGKMLYYALVFLVIALIAGFLGFGGIAFAAAGIAKILFFIFLVIFVVTLVMHLMRRV